MQARLPLVCLAMSSLFACHGSGARNADGNREQHSGEPQSNILRADYAGSEACKTCHTAEYEAWSRSAMHRMTRDVESAEVRAPFDGRTFSLRGDSATLEQSGTERHVRVRSSTQGELLFRVTKLIGGRQREDFVGVQVDPRNPQGPALGPERVLPISYLIWNEQLRYKGYSVLVTERPVLEPGVVWQQTCIFCHNSPPHFVTLFDELSGAPDVSYQGSASDDLPGERAFRYEVSDREKLVAALSAELTRLGAAPIAPDEESPRALLSAATSTRERFGEGHLLELGIGCETCHGGSREHVRDPATVRPTFALKSDFVSVTNAAGRPLSPAQDINRTCSKCHTVLFSRYPYTWEGRTRRDEPGGSPINSGEARDFLLGSCSSAMSCADCHDAHGGDQRARLEELGTPAGNPICVRCHQHLATESALEAHSHHPRGSAGSACLACHMPKKNLGLAYDLTRYHRIGSPTDPERVAGDRPLECALCHTDRSVQQMVLTMERWWGKRYDRDALRRLYGHDLRIEAVRATLLGGKPHERAVAAVAVADAGRTELMPQLVHALEDDYPLVRYYVHHALERLAGQAIALDLAESKATLRANAQSWLETRTAEH
ncbi:MAG TPA: cytochrome c3 family protein [Polyangiaceae bacterium]|nr:cytochrome c3 family protein [Polyangiaceae bacterium]